MEGLITIEYYTLYGNDYNKRDTLTELLKTCPTLAFPAEKNYQHEDRLTITRIAYAHDCICAFGIMYPAPPQEEYTDGSKT